MRKHKDLILFIAITFFWSVFVSMLKFFLRGYLDHVHVSLEEIMGYVALGCMFAYLIGGSIAYFFPKKRITIVALLVVIACVIIGQLLGFYPFPIFVTLMCIIGLMYGLRTIVKSIILSTEILTSEFSETAVNGSVNVAILAGTIFGCYSGLLVYSHRHEHGVRGLVALLILALIATLFTGYDRKFQKRPFRETLKMALPSVWRVTKKYIWLLIPIGVLWSVSTAIGQKMLELGIDVFNKMPKNSMLIILISIFGAIVGHVVSAFFTKGKRRLAMIFTIILGLCTFYFPYILNRYDYYITLTISSFVMGVFFGIAVNLLEGRFYYHIGEDGKKEYGSAAYGIITNIIIFFVMIASDILTNKIGMVVPFIFFGIILLIMPLFIRRFK